MKSILLTGSTGFIGSRLLTALDNMGYYVNLLSREDNALFKTTICDFEDGDTQSMSGAEWYKVIYESNSGWALSSNGTIFRSDIKAVVPGLLERWYAERQQMQGKLRSAKNDKESVNEYLKVLINAISTT